MSQETLHRIQKYLLIAMVVFLPITGLPKRFNVPFLGGNVSNLLLFVGVIFMVYEYYRYRFEIPRKWLQYFVLFVVWQIICLVFGLINYEYNEYLTLDQIPKLQFVLEKFSNHGIHIGKMLAIKVWLGFRFVKDILLWNNNILLICFWINHLYENNFEQAFHDLRKAIIVLVCTMGTYSLVELVWLKLGLSSARGILETINPFLYDPKEAHGWWPPLLWWKQLRSVAREPSFFGIISIMSLPILWSTLFDKNTNKLKYGFLVCYFNLMIFATNARTAIVVTSVELIILVMFTLIRFKRESFKHVTTIVIITIIAFGVNLINIRGLLNNQKVVSENSATSYVAQNVASLGNTDSRSNNARLANLVANLNTIKDFPIMGVGNGLKDAYIDARLPEFSYSNNEVRNWSRYMHMDGVLKRGYPALNKYADIAVQNGLIGLVLYMMPVLYIIYNLFIYRKSVFQDYNTILTFISMLGLLAAQMSNGELVNTNGIVWGLLVVKIASLKSETQIDNIKVTE